MAPFHSSSVSKISLPERRRTTQWSTPVGLTLVTCSHRGAAGSVHASLSLATAGSAILSAISLALSFISLIPPEILLADRQRPQGGHRLVMAGQLGFKLVLLLKRVA